MCDFGAPGSGDGDRRLPFVSIESFKQHQGSDLLSLPSAISSCLFFIFSLCSCSCNSWLQTPTLNPPARYPSQREFAPTTFTEENIAQRFAQSKLVTTCQFDEPLAGSKKTPNHLPMDEQQWTPVQVLFFGGFLATRLDRTLRLAGRGRCSWLTSGVCRMCLMDQRFAKFKGH